MEDTAGSIAKRARVLALVATFVVPTGCECGADAPSEVPVEEPVAASGARLDGELAVGAYHGCVVRGGRVLCWGMGSEGQLGDGTTRSRGEAAPVVDLDGAVGVTVGWGHGCAWREDGTARCWGHSDRDDPDDINTRPRPVRGLSDVTSMLGMPSSSRTCAIYGEGSVRCFDFEAWGSDEGTALESVHGVDDAVQLALHSDYGCARTNAGAVACWYFDGEPPIEAQELIPSGVQRIAMDPEGYALLVIDGAARRWTPFDGEPVLVEGLREVVDVSAGEGFDCVLDASGAVRCWADADRDLDAAFGPRPEPVGELGSARAIAGVGASRCALVGDAVRCWGGADLWIPDTYASATEVPDISDAAEIGAGGEITCARHADGGVSCWGRSLSGVFGEPGDDASLVPRRIMDRDVAGLIVGGDGFCAQDAAGAMRCLGRIPDAPGRATEAADPTIIPAFANAEALFFDGDGACVRRAGQGGWRCTGSVASTAEMARYDLVYATIYQSCGVRDERLACWSASAIDEPYEAVGALRATPFGRPDAIAGSLPGSSPVVCALFAAATPNIQCWPLEPGAEGPVEPVGVAGFEGARALGLVDNHLCAIVNDGNVRCARFESYPELQFVEPRAVAGTMDATEIATGEVHACARLAGGRVACFGALDRRGDGYPGWQTDAVAIAMP